MPCEKICEAFGVGNECWQENTLRAEEGGKKFILQLPVNSTDIVCCIHVDGGLINNATQQKCDYWLRRYLEKGHQNYFIEFKGSDIKHGFDQIVSTISLVRERDISLPKETIHGVIIANKVPLAAPQVQILKERFKKEHGNDFVLKSREYTHRLVV